MIAVSKSPLMPMLQARSERHGRGRACRAGEERRGLDLERRHAHQPGERDIRGARFGEQRGQLGNRAAALLLLRADVDLDEARHPRARPCPSPWPARPTRLGRSSEWIAVEQRDRLVGLVRLELADEMQLEPADSARAAPAISLALPARGSRRTRVWPASISGAIASAGWVLLTATSVTSPRSRRATRQACAMRSSTCGKQGGCAFHAPRYSGAMRARQTSAAEDLLAGSSDERNDARWRRRWRGCRAARASSFGTIICAPRARVARGSSCAALAPGARAPGRPRRQLADARANGARTGSTARRERSIRPASLLALATAHSSARNRRSPTAPAPTRCCCRRSSPTRSHPGARRSARCASACSPPTRGCR